MNNFTGQVARQFSMSEDHRASFLKSFCYSSIKYKDLILSFITYSFHCMLCVMSLALLSTCSSSGLVFKLATAYTELYLTV